MNDFLDNLSKVMNETAKKAIKASGNVVELTKTSLNIKFDEVKRDSFFKEIGKIVYGNYKIFPESASDEILGFCVCVDEIEESINAQKSKAAEIQNKKFCVECGAVLAKYVNYCYSCGARQPEIVDEPEDECCCGESCDCGEEGVEDCGCGGGCEESEISDCCDGSDDDGCCTGGSCDCNGGGE